MWFKEELKSNKATNFGCQLIMLHILAYFHTINVKPSQNVKEHRPTFQYGTHFVGLVCFESGTQI